MDDIIKKCKNQPEKEVTERNGQLYYRHNEGNIRLRESMIEQANAFMVENEKKKRAILE